MEIEIERRVNRFIISRLSAKPGKRKRPAYRWRQSAIPSSVSDIRYMILGLLIYLMSKVVLDANSKMNKGSDHRKLNCINMELEKQTQTLVSNRKGKDVSVWLMRQWHCQSNSEKTIRLKNW
ncbi:MAG: hypothetical protein OCD76_13520 [Reichenbachiella sp.]